MLDLGKDRATIEAFEAAVGPLDEVLECRRMFGDPDYLLCVAVADVAVPPAASTVDGADQPKNTSASA
jgi:hypothetical protein